MDLTHTFTVPAPIETTWAAFNDLESIAPCMPGATVQVVDDNEFTGTIKIKLGPISLVYGGSGIYVERDEAGRRVVIEAKGKDKRGQGTAGATVTALLFPEGDGTRVEVQTDLAITGKPAQFGRGVMQDVSDKLLSQFVGCISERLSAPPAPPPPTPGGAPPPPPPPPPPPHEAPGAPVDEAGSSEEVAAANAVAGVSAPDDGAPAKAPAETPAEQAGPDAGRHAAPPPPPPSPPAPPPPPVAPSPGAVSGAGDVRAVEAEAAELDLGATVLPVLLRRYGPRLAVGTAVAVIAWCVVRRRKH